MINVLYIDDEEELLEIGKHYLEISKDISVDTATSVKKAEGMLIKTKYDAIVSDYQMPVTNGIEFLKKLRAMDDHIPFILFTGKGREEVVIEALNSGADFYLQKGGNPGAQFTELEFKLKEVVRRNLAERSLKENDERLRAAQTIGKTGCWEFRLVAEGGHIWGSDEAFRIFGIPHNESGILDLEKVEECITDKERVHQALVDLIVNGKKYDLEYEIVPASGGSQKFVRSVAEIILDSEKRPVKVVGIIQDITRSKLLENELLRKTALFEAQASASMDGILVIDHDFKRIMINRRIIELFHPPQYVLDDPENDNLLLDHVMSLTKFPKQFIEKVNYLNAHILESSKDVIEFKDGMVLERFSAPVIGDNGQYYGRTWVFHDITDRLKAEEEHRASDDRYHMLFENISAPLAVYEYVYDENGEVDHWTLQDTNGPGLKLLGKASLAEVKGKNETELYGPKNREDRIDLIRELRKIGRPVTKELHFGWNNTDQLSTLFPLDANHFVSMVLDITENKLAQRKLEMSEMKFRSIYENSLDAILLTITDGRILCANPAAQRLIGASEEEIIRMGRDELVVKDERLNRGLRERAIYGKTSIDLTFNRKDGTTFEGDVTSSVFVDIDGMEKTTLMIRDITERKKMEDALLSAKKEWEKTFDQIPDPIAIVDMKHCIVRANKAMTERLKLNGIELSDGLKCYECVHGTNEPPSFCPHALTMADGKEHVAEVHEERLGGDFQLSTTPILDNHGNLVGSVHVARDVTERKRNEKAMMNANKQLSLLTGITSHDLRNQLLLLGGFIEMMEGVEDKTELAELRKKMTRSIANMQKQLEFTKVYQEMGNKAPEWFNVHELVAIAQGHLALGELVIREKGTDISILADPLIVKVMYNLIDNAIRYSHAKSLMFCAEEDSGRLKLSIEDDGVGISAADRQYLFERGYGKHTGLGLFLAREILAITDMTITETGKEGQGARFEIMVPSGNFRKIPKG